jgi:acetylglutamate kinase
MDSLNIIKIGGNVIDNSENLYHFLKDFKDLPGYKILVHGGGKDSHAGIRQPGDRVAPG